jgi:hypothetical protein
MTKIVEYRVRPVTRYVVTRFESEITSNGSACGGCEERGEFSNGDVAYQVGYALCKAEHETLGYQPGDERIKYPDPVKAKAPVSGPIGSGGLEANAHSAS